MGPRDNFGRPYGGNVLVASQLELIIPLPEKFASQARASLFYDAGNVFNTGEVAFTDKLGSPIEYKPDFDEIRTSVGIGVQWLAPLGLFRFSYAYPLNHTAEMTGTTEMRLRDFSSPLDKRFKEWNT